jgi:integrase
MKVFRFIKCGRLYTLMGKAKKDAGADLGFVTFHVLRHTWATWMRRYAGLDLQGLVATEAWADPASAARYAHVVASEESRKAALLPVEKSWKARARIGISSKIKARK